MYRWTNGLSVFSPESGYDLSIMCKSSFCDVPAAMLLSSKLFVTWSNSVRRKCDIKNGLKLSIILIRKRSPPSILSGQLSTELCIKMNIRPLSETLQKIAIEELNEDPERIGQDLQHLKDWIDKTPHLISRKGFSYSTHLILSIFDFHSFQMISF